MDNPELKRIIHPAGERRQNLAKHRLCALARNEDGHIHVPRKPRLAPPLDRNATNDDIGNLSLGQEPGSCQAVSN